MESMGPVRVNKVGKGERKRGGRVRGQGCDSEGKGG